MSIKRYGIDIKFEGMIATTFDYEDKNGDWVTHADHAAEVARLNEQVRELKSRLQLISELNEAQTALHVEAENQVRGLAAEIKLKSVQNKFLAVENDRLQTIIYKNILPYRQQGFIPGDIDDLVAATSRHMNDIKMLARAEGIHFAANRLLAAWESGFIDDTPARAYDISGAILSALEFLPNADEGEFKRDYADEVRARIRSSEEGV